MIKKSKVQSSAELENSSQDSEVKKKNPKKKKEPLKLLEEKVSLTGVSRKKIPDKKNPDEIKDEIKEEKKKKKRKKRKSKKEEFTPDAVLALCKLPFQIGEGMTGFHFDIPKSLEPVLAAEGAVVLNEFGLDFFNKYIHLAIFGGCYLSVLAAWYAGYKQHMILVQAEIEKQKADGATKVNADVQTKQTGQDN